MAIHITISGPAGAGKGTIARAFAHQHAFEYVDLGLLFRAGAYGVEQEGEQALRNLTAWYQAGDLVYHWTGNQARVLFKGSEVTTFLVSPHIAQATARISSVPENIALLTRFAEVVLASKTDVICDGRNAGTTILSSAPFKFYATASAEERAKRRLDDLVKQRFSVDYTQVLAQIQERDRLDTERVSCPFRMPEGAIILDTGVLSVEQSVAIIWDTVSHR